MEYSYPFSRVVLNMPGLFPLSIHMYYKVFHVTATESLGRIFYNCKQCHDNSSSYTVDIKKIDSKNTPFQKLFSRSPAIDGRVGIKFVNISGGQINSTNLL